MKKLFLFFFITLMGFFQAGTVFAQSESTPSSSIAVDYQFPYPGLLPDNPLYNLKIIRDKIVEFLIVDPVKKGEFYLLMSDKRLNSGVYLFKGKNKEELAYTTISKGINYLDKSIGEVENAKGQGRNITDLAKKIYDATNKDLSVLSLLQEKAPASLQGNFKSSQKKVAQLQERVKPLIPQ